MGYEALILDSFSEAFIESAVRGIDLDAINLEVGCAFGNASIKAIKSSAKMHCNDICPEHLQSLRSRLSVDELKYFFPILGDIRNLILKREYYSNILCSRVFHFFDGDEVIKTLHKLYDALEVGGKLFLVVETPFLGNW